MKNYLIHIQLQKRTQTELREFASALQQIFRDNSSSLHLAYGDIKQGIIGYLAASNLTANALRLAIDGNQAMTPGPRAKMPVNTGFQNGDTLFVAELGSDFSENGFNVLRTWLSRHRHG